MSVRHILRLSDKVSDNIQKKNSIICCQCILPVKLLLVICATGVTQWSTRPLVEANRIPHFWVCRVRNPLNLAHVDVLWENHSKLTNLFQCSFLTSTQYKVQFVKWEEPTWEADYITRLEGFTLIPKQLQVYRCTCICNQCNTHQTLPNSSWCPFFQNNECDTEIGWQRRSQILINQLDFD